MRAKTILGLLLVFCVGVIAVLVLRTGPSAPVATADSSMILVAAKVVPTGTLLRAEDVRWQSWNDTVLPGYVARPSAEQRKAKPDADDAALLDVYGSVVRQRIDAGQPVIASAITKPGDRGFLAAVLTPGYRAVSVAVTAVSGGAGLIFPGDHVDLVLTQSFKSSEETLARRSVSETVVENLRVLAIDQRVQQSQSGPADPVLAPVVARTVTLEVMPKQAEMVSVASELGKLSLILRSLDTSAGPTVASDGKETPRSTWAADVSPALREPKSLEVSDTPRVRIMRGAKTEETKQN